MKSNIKLQKKQFVWTVEVLALMNSYVLKLKNYNAQPYLNWLEMAQ